MLQTSTRLKRTSISRMQSWLRKQSPNGTQSTTTSEKLRTLRRWTRISNVTSI
jgi:hypothetical protein